MSKHFYVGLGNFYGSKSLKLSDFFKRNPKSFFFGWKISNCHISSKVLNAEASTFTVIRFKRRQKCRKWGILFEIEERRKIKIDYNASSSDSSASLSTDESDTESPLIPMNNKHVNNITNNNNIIFRKLYVEKNIMIINGLEYSREIAKSLFRWIYKYPNLLNIVYTYAYSTNII